MSKSRVSLLGGHRGGSKGRNHVTMVEIGVRRDATRRSKIAFWSVGSVMALVTGVVASGITTILAAVVIGLVTGLVVGAVVAVILFCWPAVRVGWHWAGELLVLAVVLTVYVLLVQAFAWWLAVLVMAVVLGGPFILGQVRRLVVPWVWCGISRHRLRLCFNAFVAGQRSGMAPLILLARPIPAGERVWVWLRPGLALSDIESRRDRLAAGCWASECRVTPSSQRYAALVRIDIARRNPLAGRVNAPFSELGASVDVDTDGPASSGLDLSDVDGDGTAEAVVPRRRRAIGAVSEKPEPVVVPAVTEVDDLENWI